MACAKPFWFCGMLLIRSLPIASIALPMMQRQLVLPVNKISAGRRPIFLDCLAAGRHRGAQNAITSPSHRCDISAGRRFQRCRPDYPSAARAFMAALPRHDGQADVPLVAVQAVAVEYPSMGICQQKQRWRAGNLDGTLVERRPWASIWRCFFRIILLEAVRLVLLHLPAAQILLSMRCLSHSPEIFTVRTMFRAGRGMPQTWCRPDASLAGWSVAKPPGQI